MKYTLALIIFQALHQPITTDNVRAELAVPEGRIHVQVTSADHKGSLSCLILTNSKIILAGQVAQGSNSCDFNFNNPVDTALMLLLQNGDVLPHTYNIVLEKR